MRTYWALFVFIALVGCSSGGGSDSNETAAAGTVIDSRFVGLWDQTSIIDEEYGDINYYFIGQDGFAFNYEYYGDPLDNPGSCYRKSDYREEHYGREGSNYRITQVYEPASNFDFSLLISLEVVDNELQATALETIDERFVKGEIFKLGTRLTEISITDIENQLCTES